MKTLILPQSAVHVGTLILVNRQFPFAEDAGARHLVPEGGERVLLERGAAYSLSRLMAELDGWRFITPVSGWRSLQEQRDIYAQSLRDSGADFTKKYVALPGHSEHQTGLAVDLALKSPNIDFIRPDFPYTGVCGGFRARAAAYGFIERYPDGKEAVTGIAHEPWHFRYVGAPHAKIMAGKGLTLEEYHDSLKGFPLGGKPLCWRAGRLEYAISYIEAGTDGDTRVELDRDGPYTLSGDNGHGFILTAWTEAGA